MNLRTLAALGAAFILAACSIGDDDEPASMAGPSLSEVYATGSVLVATPLGVLRAESECDGMTCTISIPRLGISEQVDLEAVLEGASDAQQAATDVTTQLGVQKARVEVVVDNLSFDTLAAWGEHNFATTGKGSATVAGQVLEFTIPAVIGQSAETNPVSGSATWSGLMVGVKYGGSALGAEVEGEATMQVNFAGATLDLDLTNIVETDAGTQVADIGWQDVPMQDGEFAAADGSMEGYFYGPDHEEAGGAFDRSGIAGAFSLDRQ